MMGAPQSALRSGLDPRAPSGHSRTPAPPYSLAAPSRLGAGPEAGGLLSLSQCHHGQSQHS